MQHNNQSRVPQRTRYEKSDVGLDVLSRKLMLDLRGKMYIVRKAEPLTEEWCTMKEFICQLANISQVEARLEKGSHARKTLWESEEKALKFLLEEDKILICTENLLGLYSFNLEKREKLSKKEEAMLDDYERGVGLLLKNAWCHAEALQQIAPCISELFEYFSHVLKQSLRNRKISSVCSSNAWKKQDILVLHYLHAFCTYFVEKEDIMDRIQENTIIDLLIEYIDLFHDDLHTNDKLAALQALSLLFDNEHFQAYSDAFLSNASLNTLPTFRSILDDEQYLDDSQIRKSILPLLRFIQVRS